MDNALNLRGEKIKEELSSIESLIERVHKLRTIPGSNVLLRKIVSEQKFHVRLKSENYTDEQLDIQLKSSNVPSIEAIITVAEKCNDVVYLLQPFSVASLENEKLQNNLNLKAKEKKVVVDVIASSGNVWYKVFARNPIAIHQIWEGNCQFGEKNIAMIGKQYLQASLDNPLRFVPPKVVFAFACGVTKSVSKELKSIGIHVTGNIIEDPILNSALSKSVDRNCGKRLPDMYNWFTPVEFDTPYTDVCNVNLDVTALVAIVSSVTNDCINCCYSGDFLQSHIEEERVNRILPDILNFLENKTLIVSQTALDDFLSIVESIAGQSEKDRAMEFLKRVNVVPDRTPEEAGIELTCSGRIKQRALTIFSTGEYHKAVTVTANTSFIRAAQSQRFVPNVFIHASRALGERKKINS